MWVGLPLARSPVANLDVRSVSAHHFALTHLLGRCVCCSTTTWWPLALFSRVKRRIRAHQHSTAAPSASKKRLRVPKSSCQGGACLSPTTPPVPMESHSEAQRALVHLVGVLASVGVAFLCDYALRMGFLFSDLRVSAVSAPVPNELAPFCTHVPTVPACCSTSRKYRQGLSQPLCSMGHIKPPVYCRANDGASSPVLGISGSEDAGSCPLRDAASR